MIKEIWKDIPNYVGYYQVSSLGRVKSVKRKVKHSENTLRIQKERILKPSISGSGYYKVVLAANGNVKTYHIHQLSAMAFLKHEPNKGEITVDHIDNNPFNNCIENLQIISVRENLSKDKKGSSKYIGVCWCSTHLKWLSRIIIKGKRKHLGYFKNELDASQAYQTALRQL